jgi:hypothetical protein
VRVPASSTFNSFSLAIGVGLPAIRSLVTDIRSLIQQWQEC